MCVQKPSVTAPLRISRKESSIEFRDVHFSYLPAQPILAGLSFKVPSGHKVGIVGGSGSGYSSERM